MGAHELRTVQKCQAFLGLQLDGIPAQLFPYIGRRTDLSFVQHFSKADERKAHVGKGCQVSGSPQGTLLVHDGKHIFVEHVNQTLHGDKLRPGMAVGKGLRLQEQHQFHDFRTHFFSGAAGMGHHQVVLELAQVLFGNGYVVQRAETGGDTVNRTADVLHFLVQVGTAFYDGVNGFLRQRQLFMPVDNFFYPFQGKMCK